MPLHGDCDRESFLLIDVEQGSQPNERIGVGIEDESVRKAKLARLRVFDRHKSPTYWKVIDTVDGIEFRRAFSLRRRVLPNRGGPIPRVT